MLLVGVVLVAALGLEFVLVFAPLESNQDAPPLDPPAPSLDTPTPHLETLAPPLDPLSPPPDPNAPPLDPPAPPLDLPSPPLPLDTLAPPLDPPAPSSLTRPLRTISTSSKSPTDCFFLGLPCTPLGFGVCSTTRSLKLALLCLGFLQFEQLACEPTLETLAELPPSPIALILSF
nr:hypothetical protein [Tanacetum cinerariifolium]